MKIKSIRIQNLRSFRDDLITFNDYTCFVGPNGAGKSTVLCALNIFFRETAHSATDLTCLQEEDFHRRDTSNPITITVTFSDLSEEAQADFASYYRQEELVISSIATFDPETGKAQVQQFGQRRGMADFKPYFKADGEGKTVQSLKDEYASIKRLHPDLPTATTKAAMTQALRDYEDGHPELCELIPSSDQFYGFTKGGNLLAKYIQWVFVPAIKDASSEQFEGKDTSLSKLLARTVRSKSNIGDEFKALQRRMQEEYQRILQENQESLGEISTALAGRLADWSHPETSLKLEWRHDPVKSVRVDEPLAEIIAGEGEFVGNLTRFGHGLQRSYLLALLQELSGCNTEEGPRLLLCCEEPELFQHPPQAQYLADVLQKLAASNAQVFVCTHSPYFVSGTHFDGLRLVRKSREDLCSYVSAITLQELARLLTHASGGTHPPQLQGITSKIHQALQPALNEMFFTPFLVLVEGLEDVAYITAYLHLSGMWERWRRVGCHIVPASGKSSMIQPLAVAKLAGIPVHAIFDSDAHAPVRDGRRQKHDKDNSILLKLFGIDYSLLTRGDDYFGNGVTMWGSEMSEAAWSTVPDNIRDVVKNEVERQHGHVGGLEKNSLFIADTLSSAWDKGYRFEVLKDLCESILKSAEDNIPTRQ